MRPVDLARAAGLSAQTVRNYEAQRVMSPARRTPSGYRVYDQRHLDALLAFTTLVRAVGHHDATAIMSAITDGRTSEALEYLDRTHAHLAAGRATVRDLELALQAAIRLAPTPPVSTSKYTVGELARHVGVTPAALRGWEQADILHPRRHPNGHREYTRQDALDARVAALLRRGNFPLESIAAAINRIHQQGDASTALAQLHDWRQDLHVRSRRLLAACAHLHRCIPTEVSEGLLHEQVTVSVRPPGWRV